MTWNGTTKLYYYREGFPATNAVTSAAAMLANTNHNGQCGAWAQLMAITLGVNGVPFANAPASFLSPVTFPNHPDGEYFLVKAWAFGPGNTNEPAYPWVLEVGKDHADRPMLTSPIVPSGTITNRPGLGGQNSPTPAEKIFGNHQVVQYRDAKGQISYYDPSYGRVYTSVSNFYQDCVAGIAKVDAESPNTNAVKLKIKLPFFRLHNG